MKLLKNIKIYFFWEPRDLVNADNEKFLKYHSEDVDLFHNWRKYDDNSSVTNKLKLYEEKYNSYISDNKEVHVLDELYFLTEIDEQNFQCTMFSNLSRLCSYVDRKVLVTNLSNLNIDLIRGMNIDFYDKNECDQIFVDKVFLIKNLWFEGKNYFNPWGDHPDRKEMVGTEIETISNSVNKKNLVFFRQDADCGQGRCMDNYNDVKELFKKYDFVVKDDFSSLTFYEKKIYLNNFDNIFLEGGAGNINLFLIDPDKKTNIFLLNAPTYDSIEVLHPLRGLKSFDVKSLDIGILTTESDREYNRPWKVDLIKLENILKEIK